MATAGPARGGLMGQEVDRWLVIGAGGMLGREVCDVLSRTAAAPWRALTSRELDITDSIAVDAAVIPLGPRGVVLNCAAYTRVDDAESHEARAFAVNATGPANLARACRRGGARLLHVSTDYVFDGCASTPYEVEHPTGPRSAYGRTKLAGEWAVRAELPDRSWIVRTAWLYGRQGPDFVHTMLQMAEQRPTVDVVDDQRGQPTSAADLAAHLVTLAGSDAPAGTYHATNAGQVSWFDFAQRIFQLAGHDPSRVRPTTSDAFVRPARRPRWSVLAHTCWAGTGLAPMRPWDEALDSYVTERRPTAPS